MPRILFSLSLALLFLALQPGLASACPGKEGKADKHKVELVAHKDGKATARFTSDKGAEAVKALQDTMTAKLATYAKGKPACKPGCAKSKKEACPLSVKGLTLKATKIKTGMELVATGPEKALKEFASAVEKRGKIGGFCSCGGDKAKCGCGGHEHQKGEAPHAKGTHGGCPHAAGGEVFKPEPAKKAGCGGGCPHAKTGGCGGAN
jgi:hypothetical protein